MTLIDKYYFNKYDIVLLMVVCLNVAFGFPTMALRRAHNKDNQAFQRLGGLINRIFK